MHPKSLPSPSLFSASMGNPGEKFPWALGSMVCASVCQQVGELRGDALKLAPPDLASSPSQQPAVTLET